SVTDLTQIGRFVAALDTASSGSEFQRADCAPRNTLGDGRLTVSDFTQAGRYAAGLDPLTSAGGPTASTTAFNSVAEDLANRFGRTLRSEYFRILQELAATRVLRIVDTNASSSGSVTVNVELVAQGDENAVSFSITY